MDDLRDALLVDICKLKAQISEEKDAKESLTLAITALLRRHHQLGAQARKNREEKALRKSRGRAAPRARGSED